MDAPLQKLEKSTDTGRTVRIKEEVNQEYTKDKDMLKMHILFFFARKGHGAVRRSCGAGAGPAAGEPGKQGRCVP